MVAATSVNYFDRQVLSVLAPVLRERFAWTNTDYSILIFAFLLGWALGEVPLGMLIDRIGARRGYLAVVTAWSAAILAHAFARTLPHFALLRLLLGFCECGNWSAGMKAIAQWFPAEERAKAAGIFNGAINLGAILAPPVTIWLTLRYGWQAPFVFAAVLGFLWLLPWARLYRATWEPVARDRVRSHQIPAGGIRHLLRTAECRGLIAARFLIGPVWSLYVFWLPEYLKRERHMSLDLIGLLSWIPFAISVAGSVVGGAFSDRLVARRYSPIKARRIALTVAALLSSTGIGVAIAPGVVGSFVLICVAAFGLSFWAANFYALISDVYPAEQVGRVTALTGVGNGVGGCCTCWPPGWWWTAGLTCRCSP